MLSRLEFDLEKIRQQVDMSLHWLAQVPSTNDWAAKLVRQGQLPDQGAIVLTNQQTAGRGRRGNQWDSSQGCLTFTMAIKFESMRSVWTNQEKNWVALATGCAVCQVIQRLGFDASVKWPNDIMFQDRKLGGILIESIAGDALLIGCGINLQNDVSKIDNAVSLQNDWPTGTELTTKFLIDLVKQIHDQLDSLADGIAKVHRDFQEVDWLRGKRIRWVADQNRPEKDYLTGVADGVDEMGGIRIITPDGIAEKYSGSILALIS